MTQHSGDLTTKELLWRIDERVERLQVDFTKICNQTEGLRRRIERIEKWQSYILGIGGVLGAALSLFGTKIVDAIFN